MERHRPSRPAPKGHPPDSGAQRGAQWTDQRASPEVRHKGSHLRDCKTPPLCRFLRVNEDFAMKRHSITACTLAVCLTVVITGGCGTTDGGSQGSYSSHETSVDTDNAVRTGNDAQRAAERAGNDAREAAERAARAATPGAYY